MAELNSIIHTLNQPYDTISVINDVFLKCISNKHEFLEIPVVEEISSTDSKILKKVKNLGRLILDDDTSVHCFEIELQPNVILERSKVSIQNYIRKKLLTGQAALINFITPEDIGRWRLTLVAKDVEFVEGSLKEKETNPKRYTYLIDTDSSNRTVAERLLNLTEKPKITLEDLIEAFSIEKLSKLFFNYYEEHFNKINEFLYENHLGVE